MVEQRKGLLIAVQMNGGYYSALSHFFPHSSGFALIRHVRTDGKLRRRPAFPWARRSAVRIGCADLGAAHIADKRGVPTRVSSGTRQIIYTQRLSRRMSPLLSAGCARLDGASSRARWGRSPCSAAM